MRILQSSAACSRNRDPGIRARPYAMYRERTPSSILLLIISNTRWSFIVLVLGLRSKDIVKIVAVLVRGTPAALCWLERDTAKCVNKSVKGVKGRR